MACYGKLAASESKKKRTFANPGEAHSAKAWKQGNILKNVGVDIENRKNVDLPRKS